MKPEVRRDALEYMEMVTFVFQNPNWMMNVLFVAICNFIPVIGPIVILGYQFDVVESLIRSPGATYPDFNFNLFVEYLKRGVWPFLVALVLGMLASVVMMGVFFGGMAAIAASAGPPGAAPANAGIPLVVLFGLFGSFFAIGVGLQLILLPFQLRAGLIQDFATAFDVNWAWKFVATIWIPGLLGMLWLFVIGMAAGIVGMAMLCVGIYFTIAIVYLVQAHFMYQLYEIFLTRGGAPINWQPIPRKLV